MSLADGLHLMDCLAGLALLPEASVDLVFADLPYGTTQNHWDTIIPMDLLWPALRRVAKPTTPFVFTAMQPFTSLLVMSAPKLFKYEMIWHKSFATGFLNAKKQPLRQHEDVLVFYISPEYYWTHRLHTQARHTAIAATQLQARHAPIAATKL